VIMDLAVPRDVEPEIGCLPRVSLFNIDDLKEEIGLNLLRRRIEAIQAEKIVEEEVGKFCQQSKLALVPVG